MTDQVTAQSRASEQTREDLLKVALKVFSETGFDGASLRDISTRAGVAHGLIRYHFETKEKLWLATIDYLFMCLYKEELFSDEDIRRLIKGDLSEFRRFLRGVVRYSAKYPEHVRLMMIETVHPTPRLREVVRKYSKANHKRLLTVFRSLMKQGVLPKSDNPETYIYIITGACQNIYALAGEAEIMGYNVLSEAAIEAHADLVVQIFCPEDNSLESK